MKLRISSTSPITAILMAGFLGIAGAQESTMDGTIGFGHPFGTGEREWNPGLSVGTNWLSWPIEGLGIGLRFGYNRWTPSGCDRCGQSGDALNPETKGSATIFEVVPSARLRTQLWEYGITLFGQGGVGLFILRADSDATGLVGGKPSTIQFDGGKWIGRWGFQIGPGISFALDEYVSMDMFPLYTTIFNGNHTFQFFMVHTGISVRF